MNAPVEEVQVTIEIPDWGDPDRSEPAWRVAARQYDQVVAERAALEAPAPVRVIVPVKGRALVTVPLAEEVPDDVLLAWLQAFNGNQAKTSVADGVGLIARGRARRMATTLARFYRSCEIQWEFSEVELCTHSCNIANPGTDCVCCCGGSFHAEGRGGHAGNAGVTVFVAAESIWTRREMAGPGQFANLKVVPVAPVAAEWRPSNQGYGIVGAAVVPGVAAVVKANDGRRTLVVAGPAVGALLDGRPIFSTTGRKFELN